MGKYLEHKLECGCEFWIGNDYQGIDYFQIEACSCHKNVKVEVYENRQPTELASSQPKDSTGQPYKVNFICGECGKEHKSYLGMCYCCRLSSKKNS